MRALLVCLALLGCNKSEPKPSPATPTEAQKPAEAPPVKQAATAPAGDLAWRNIVGDAKLAATLADFAQEADAAGKKPYVYLHASWCEPCNAIEATHAKDAKMVDAFAGTAIALIDVDTADIKVMNGLALKSGVIPVFYKLDATGKPTGASIDGGAWGDNVPANMAPPLKAFFAK